MTVELDVEAIANPTAHGEHNGIGPEESGDENAELRIREAELVFEQRCGDSEVSAVDVVDQDGNSEQQQPDGKRAAVRICDTSG
jgi:hypothetical protein